MSPAQMAVLRGPLTGPADSVGGPTPRFIGDLWWATTTGNGFTANNLYVHNGTSWGLIPAAAGAPPTGAAGGVLTGTYPNPTLNLGYGLTNSSAPAASLTQSSTSLGADTSVASGGTNLLSLTLAAGTWLVSATALVLSGGATDNLEGRLWDNVSTTYVAAGGNCAANGVYGNVAIAAWPIVLGGSTTVQFQVSSTGTATAKKTTSNNSWTPATAMSAVRIA